MSWEVVVDKNGNAKRDAFTLPNGDMVLVERRKQKGGNVEVVFMYKYTKSGKRGFSLRKESVKEFVRILEEVASD